MNRENFQDGSVEQIIFDYWNGNIHTNSDFENALNELPQEELVDFIMTCQSKGKFKGFIHD